MIDFKRLLVWQRSHALSVSIDVATRAFSRRGYANLRTQLTRAMDSIPANIAEGCGGESKRELARYLDISLTSTNETEHHLLSARDRGLLPKEEWERYAAETIEIRKMLYVYRRKVLQSITSDST